MKYTLPVFFALCTALCWGLYGPTVANARDSQKPPRWSPFKPYVFIGVAYVVVAIAGGAVAMQAKGDSFNFGGEESAAATWGFAAGILGALGALGLTSAMLSFEGKPKPELVMPIVFGGAVTITAIASIVQSRNLASADPRLWLGMALVVTGVVLVAYFTPHGHPPKPGESHAVQSESAAPPETATSDAPG